MDTGGTSPFAIWTAKPSKWHISWKASGSLESATPPPAPLPAKRPRMQGSRKQRRKLGARPLGGKKNEHFRGWNGLFISRGEAILGAGNESDGGGEGHSFRSGMAEGVRRLRGHPRAASGPARGSGRGGPPGGGCTAGGRRLACLRRKGGRPNAPPCRKARHPLRSQGRSAGGGKGVECNGLPNGLGQTYETPVQ